MRSVSEMVKRDGMKAGKKSDYNKAVNYLRKQRRYMNYAARLSEGCPIGSGIVESACKQIVTEPHEARGNASEALWNAASDDVTIDITQPNLARNVYANVDK